jgi:Trk K+ transport system NAD-binding subunit
MIPHTSPRLELGDRLTLLGELSALQDVQRLPGRE